ncbi:MAG TPA: tetratricopeptide repeat protein [Gemmataceae bacterium]|nr:tetratricopeptide repeat protein [Gemmataceae bacterium]
MWAAVGLAGLLLVAAALVAWLRQQPGARSRAAADRLAAQLTEAGKHFRQVLASDPTHGGANRGLSEALRHQGQAKEAVRFGRRAVRWSNPPSAEALLTLAEAYVAAKRLPDARKTLEQALDAAAVDNPPLAAVIHIDRGPHSRRVLDRLIALAGRCRLVPLLGNHEEVLLAALRDISQLRRWLALGGGDTLRSYGWSPGGPRRALADWIPQPHQDFLAGCRPYYETASHLFVHAGFVPELAMAEQPGLALRRRVTDAATARPHGSGKVAVGGHTPQRSGEVLDLGFLVCIDTNCVHGGWLTALDTGSGRVWQADRSGRLRKGSGQVGAAPA